MQRGFTNVQGLQPASIWQRAQRKRSEWWMKGWQIPFPFTTRHLLCSCQLLLRHTPKLNSPVCSYFLLPDRSHSCWAAGKTGYTTSSFFLRFSYDKATSSPTPVMCHSDPKTLSSPFKSPGGHSSNMQVRAWRRRQANISSQWRRRPSWETLLRCKLVQIMHKLPC